MAVQPVGELIDDKVWHVDVDFAGQFDETSAEVELTCLPREVERVNGDAVTAESGAWIKGLETERFGLCCVDDLVDVDAHTHTQLLELVHQCDVHAAVDVLEQLGHLSHGGAADRHHAPEDGAVKGASKFGGNGAASAHNLGNIVPGNRIITGVFALGRKGHVDTAGVRRARDPQAAGVASFKQRYHDFFGSAGIGRAFEDDELAVAQVWRNRHYRAGHIAQVRLVILVQGCRDADDDGVHLVNLGVVRRRVEAGLLRFLNHLREDTNNVGAASVERGDFVCGNVEAVHAEALAREQQRQRQAHIAHANDAHTGLTRFDLLLQGIQSARDCDGHFSIVEPETTAAEDRGPVVC